MTKRTKKHDHWYKLARWQHLRSHQLRIEPLCAFCLQRGVVTLATIVDHVEPHRGDVNRFWLGKLQTLCKSCHDSTNRLVEQRGYLPDVGPDGWPLDPRHPVYNR